MAAQADLRRPAGVRQGNRMNVISMTNSLFCTALAGLRVFDGRLSQR
jgi:hypothetical protein